MLPDLSAAHIFILVVVALIVVGPKDLPAMLRKIGQFMGKLRGMANEFRASFDEMARQSELDELRKEVEAMRAAAGNPTAHIGREVENLITDPGNPDHVAVGELPASFSIDPPAPAPEASILPPKTKPKGEGKAKAASTAKAKTPAKAKTKGAAPKTAKPKGTGA